MTDKIWIVVRTTGEYSFRSEDPIYWFKREADAQAFCVEAMSTSRDAAQKWRRYIESRDYDYDPDDHKRFSEGLLDASFDPSSYGADEVSYSVWELTLGPQRR